MPLPLISLLLSLSLPLPLVSPDTTITKLSLLAADRALFVAVATRGASALFDRVGPEAAILFPGAPLYRSAAEARAPWIARYGKKGWLLEHDALHAVAGLDDTFGCTVGITRLYVPTDTDRRPRLGRYIACWHRDATRDGWHLAGYTRTNDDPGGLPPADKLEHAPHSATVRALKSGAESAADVLAAAQRADSAFAARSITGGPADAFGTWSASDAMMLGTLPKPRQGPAAIGGAFKGFPKDGVFQWSPVRTLGAAGGGLAFTSGEAFNVVGGKRSNTKYITVWRLEPDGEWRFIFDSGSDRP